ncbi:uncharacterized protein [Chironomus tepperi]|uniref:uncharacterized protein n=1 Tax=Chironomus tepperi TaxID=113505 RepID=UPI00391F0E03
MNVEDLGSLAQWFLNDHNAKAEYRAKNPTSKIVNNYIFAIDLVKDHVRCGLNNACKWFEAQEEEQQHEDLQKLVLCITCDRIYHLRCAGCNVTSLTEVQLPWMCQYCLTNPMNAAAQAVVSSEYYMMPFDERIKQFIKETSHIVHQSEESSSDYDEMINESLHINANGSLSSHNLRTDFNKLQKKFKSIRQSNKDLKSLVLAQTEQISQIMGFLQSSTMNGSTIGARSNSGTYNTADHARDQEASFTNAVLNANRASTRLDDEIRQSSRVINEMIGVHGKHEGPQSLPNQQNNSTSDSHIETTLRQLNKLSINEIRRNLPKLEKFDGNPERWLSFERAVMRNWAEGEYTDDQMKSHIRQALTGQALARIDSLYMNMSSQRMMDYLKDSFGNSNIVVESARNKLLSTKLSRPLTHASCVEVTTRIANFMAACSYAGITIADTSISSRLHGQLEPYHQELYYKFYYEKHPEATTRMERLDVQFEFLNNISKTLPLGNFKFEEEKATKNKSKDYQVMTASVINNSANVSAFTPDSYKYEIRDNQTAKYLGYDMNKVKQLPKKCEICNKTNHFAVECKTYRELRMDGKYNLVRSKRLCMNCILTSGHMASECDLKSGCGFKVDKTTRCSAKHHITLHRGNTSTNFSKTFRKQHRRQNTNANAARAKEKIEEHQQSQQATISNQPEASGVNNHIAAVVHHGLPNQLHVVQGYPCHPPKDLNQVKPYATFTISRQLCAVNESSERTIKLFKTIFYGHNCNAIGYAIGDSAAEITLIKRDLVDELGITGENCIIELQWTDSSKKLVDAIKIKLKISGVGNGSEIIELNNCYAVNDLSLPPRTLNVEALKKQFPYLRKVPFASYENAVASILIGSTHAYLFEAIEPVIQDGQNKPVALKSKLGYTIYGGALECVHHAFTVNMHQGGPVDIQDANEELNRIYTYSCAIESLGIKPMHNHLKKDEQLAIEKLEKGMKILPSGSVEVPLVWASDNPVLPDNYPMVYKRQIAQENKLRKNPELLEAFNNNFIELINENYVRPAREKDINGNWPNVNYLPMSLVVNQNKHPIKTRNVYDAAARYQGTSLNEQLLMGPNLLVDMLKPLMRMRMNKIAFTGDVKSMFHRIFISEQDQQCQRILWRYNLDDPLQIYIMQVMLFGPKCSPFVSQFVKNKTADKWEARFSKAARALKDFTYMDDLISSEETVEAAVEVATQCIEILKTINWDLVGFQSNSLEVLQALNTENVKRESIEFMTAEEASYTTKVLGVAWNPKTDAYEFNLNKNAFIKLVTECGHKPTKRDQCSTIARIFDILGLISHCIIRGRILLQRSWRKKLGWDEEIDDDEHKAWLNWLNDLEKVSLLKIPRLRFPSYNMTQAATLELHTFCDAGKEAIAAVSYLVGTFNGYRQVSFVMSKAKVAPIKIKTKTEISEMPRLEMLSALLAARLSDTIRKHHDDFNLERFQWSDSQIVLNWLKNDNINLPRFAVSPVEEILELTEQSQWNYVDSKNNAADLATKFQKLNFADINTVWYQGPSFLRAPRDYWPKQKVSGGPKAVIGNVQAINVTPTIKLPPIDCQLANDFIIDLLRPTILSRWSKLVRAIGRALKLYYEAIIPLLKSKQWNNHEARESIRTSKNFNTLTKEEILRAELFIIRRIQREVYTHEYEKLRKGKRISNPELLQLNVFMDTNEVIRINSRVKPEDDSYAQTLAPLVPRKSELSFTLLFDYHYKFRHVMLEAQVAEFRGKYWMPQLRSALKEVKSLCNYCGFRRANPVEYKMAPLPNVRVDAKLKPFEVTGLDCAGPCTIYAKNGHQKKVWILIFTCTMSRFIQLHVLDSLTSLEVFQAIMVLWTSHGPIREFISDNGTNFVGTANIIRHDSKAIIDFLKEAKKDLEAKLAQETYASWTFIPVQSPWFGAFYERLIQTVKRSIQEAIEGKKITRIEFNIALQETAHRVNCRPLTHNPISSEDEEVLTPHHLAKYRSGWPLLPSIHGLSEIPDPLSDKDQYRRGRILADEMARKFVSQYLPVLTKRTKWFKDSAPIKTGDLVLLIDPNKTRKAWERARVLKIYSGKDKIGRVVDLLMPNGATRKNRSVKRLAKIEIKSM